MPHTQDEKVNVIRLHAEGFTYPQIAEETSYSVSGAKNIVRKWEEHQTVERKSGSGRPRKVTPQTVQDAVELFEQYSRSDVT